MTGGFDHFLHEGFLFLEVGLNLKKSLAAAHRGVGILAASFAFSAKFLNVEAALGEYGLDPFGLIGPFFKYHPSRMRACLPPGLVFIRLTSSASGAYAAWPSSFALGSVAPVWYFSGIIFISRSARECLVYEIDLAIQSQPPSLSFHAADGVLPVLDRAVGLLARR
ncbi:hypothetical protein B0H13DRAFT_2327572 [Mycena leptocephala]|nr:hypothetical protein B0H13DRAFT_2327572 [Mycena leptocephala]